MAREPSGGGVGDRTKARHLPALDLIRFVVVGGVIAVHTTSLTMPASDVAAGAVLIVLHVSREIFLFLSAFVLAYSPGGRALAARSFWRRRYPLVLVPYVAWTAIYLLADGSFTSPLTMTKRFAVDLADSGARYHLYFVLVTMQLYAIFPWLYRLLARRPNWHRTILVASVAFQLAFTAAIHYDLRLPRAMEIWLTHPGSWLPSYQLYVVAGVIAALHLEEIHRWMESRKRLIAAAALVAVAGALASYFFDVSMLGMTPVRASEVFQPAVLFECLAFTALLYLLGVGVAERAGSRTRVRLETTADVSFGVYLAHPLLLQAALAGIAGISLTALMSALPPAYALPLVLLCFVPALYLSTAVAVGLARQSPFSLILTGRKRVGRGTSARLERSPSSSPVGGLVS
jgi:peptidoglycan/LPS O-acetylase OafA/YrhL